MTVDPATLLLPGTLCDAALWADVARPPHARVVDVLRGASLAEAASRVLAAAPGGRPLHLVGFSLGAIVALEVLRRAPERLARLTLVSANPLAPAPHQLVAWEQQERLVRDGRFEDVARATAAAAGPHHDAVLAMARRVGPEAFLDQLALLRARPDSRPDLARHAGPLALLVGADDAVTPPPLAREARDLARHATLRIVPNAAHYLPLDAPGEIADALRAESYA